MRNFVYFVVAIVMTGGFFSFIGHSPVIAAVAGI